MTQPFWKKKCLEELSPEEWESLCDRCGRCCLMKLQDEDTDEVYFTDVACRLYDEEKCQCRDYANRQSKVDDCVALTPETVRTLSWLPVTCAYRLIREGKDLYPWHPLVSGQAATVHESGASTLGKVVGHEGDFTLEELMDHIRKWPDTVPG